jgi:uncharacterized protein (TIGR03435 family)
LPSSSLFPLPKIQTYRQEPAALTPLVVDKTGLEGIFDFSVDMQPELNTDSFTAWQRALEDQLGLRINSQKGEVAVVVVDDAARIPNEN